jgi:hypothetical protein
MTCSCSSLLDTLERVKALLRPPVSGEWWTPHTFSEGSGFTCFCPNCKALRILEAGMSEAGKGER